MVNTKSPQGVKDESQKNKSGSIIVLSITHNLS